MISRTDPNYAEEYEFANSLVFHLNLLASTPSGRCVNLSQWYTNRLNCANAIL
jgi:hypothetical protein